MNLEKIKENKIESLTKKFTNLMNELKDIEKFVTEQLKDEDDPGRKFRFNMFARHFQEVFVLTRLFKDIEKAIGDKKEEELWL